MDQAELYGRVIKVNQAKPQKAAGEKLGSKTAVWEQVSFSLFLLTRDIQRFLFEMVSLPFSRIDFLACDSELFADFFETGGLRHQTQRQRRRQDGHRRWREQTCGPDARARRFGSSRPEAQLSERASILLLSRLFLRKPHGIQRGVWGVFCVNSNAKKFNSHARGASLSHCKISYS